MPPPPGYHEAMRWWFYMGADIPTQSVFPDQLGGPRWVAGQIPQTHRVTPYDSQGWKIHVCVHPDNMLELYQTIGDLLRRRNAAHKFMPFQDYSRLTTGSAAFARIGTPAGESGAGKACVVYPTDPVDLRNIATEIDNAITQANALARRPVRGAVAQGMRPFPGGVKGDLKIGRSGFVYCRYGGFQGGLADREQIYDPVANQVIPDPRYTKAFPDFIRTIPSEIMAIRR